MSAGCYWAVHCYNGLAVLMAPAPVAPDEGCWRTVLRELSGSGLAMGCGGEGCAVS